MPARGPASAARCPTVGEIMTLQYDPALTPFFDPRGVVLLGASANPIKLGFGLARNLLQSGYSGAIHFVNVKGGALLDRPLYRQVADVPDPVDLAVMLIPPAAVPAALEACGRRGIRATIIASGGFREIGPDGAALEAECLAVAQAHGMRLLGPNCIGLLDTHLPLDVTFLPPPGPTPGQVAFISHSGAICAAVIDWARGQGFGLSRLVSLGNQADVTETDVLPAVAADPHTRVITLYLEGVSDGRRFVAEAREVGRHKPIVALKVGRFSSGRRAVASHTGALAGEDTAFTAAFRRAGVIRAETSEELFDWARALAWCPLPRGNCAAVLTNAGGPGVTAVDALEAHGLCLATLTEPTKAALRAILPPAASIGNPVDMLAAATPEQYSTCLRLLLEDPEVDSVMVILPPPPMYSAGGVARAMIPIIYAADKPVVVALMGERLIQEAVEHFRSARVPEYRFPERAAAALAVLWQRASSLEQALDTAPTLADIAHDVAQAAVAAAPARQADAPCFLPPEAIHALLTAYGLQAPPQRLARSAAEAVDASRAMGLPVALKLDAPTVTHKSDVGGVVLRLATEAAVAEAYDAIMARLAAARPEAEARGALVQPMAPPGQEVILGALQDPQFGPLIMFGAGGVEVETQGDVDFALAPLGRRAAEALLQRTVAGRRLAGTRGHPPSDREAVIDALIRLGRLAADFPQIAEIEINPLIVLPDGQGALAVDARARLA